MALQQETYKWCMVVKSVIILRRSSIHWRSTDVVCSLTALTRHVDVMMTGVSSTRLLHSPSVVVAKPSVGNTLKNTGKWVWQIRLWLVVLNRLGMPQSYGIVGSRDRWEFPPFSEGTTVLFPRFFHSKNCLPLGLCKETVKESIPAHVRAWRGHGDG